MKNGGRVFELPRKLDRSRLSVRFSRGDEFRVRARLEALKRSLEPERLTVSAVTAAAAAARRDVVQLPILAEPPPRKGVLEPIARVPSSGDPTEAWRSITRVLAWGFGDAGEAGPEVSGPAALAAPRIVDLSSAGVDVAAAVDVACGPAATLVVTSTGLVLGVGSTVIVERLAAVSGQPRFVPCRRPRCVPLPVPICSIGCGDAHCAAAGADGSVYTWGDASRGRLAHAEVTSSGLTGLLAGAQRFRPPARVAGLSADGVRIARIACGTAFTLALTHETGRVWSWGANDAGQCGTGSRTETASPSEIRLDSTGGQFPIFAKSDEAAKAFWIAAGAEHSAIVTADGCVWTAGRLEHGRLGRPAPVGIREGPGDGTMRRVAALTTPSVMVACGGAHTVVLGSDSRVRAFGWNAFGQTGRPTPEPGRPGIHASEDEPMPRAGASIRQVLPPQGHEEPDEVRVLAMQNALCGFVAAGWATSAAVDHRGRLWTWGGGTDGQLGRASHAWSRNEPGLVHVPDSSASMTISLGRRHAAAVTFRRPADMHARPEPGCAEQPLWHVAASKGVPVAEAVALPVPPRLASLWGTQTAYRLRAIRFTQRLQLWAARGSRTISQALKTDSSNFAVLGRGGSVNEPALWRALAVTRDPLSGPKRFETYYMGGGRPKRARRPVHLISVQPSLVFEADRLLRQRVPRVQDDSEFGVHAAACVVQHCIRSFLGRREMHRRVLERRKREDAMRSAFSTAAAQAARIAARLRDTLQGHRLSLEAAHRRRIEERRRALLARAEADLSMSEQEREARLVSELLRATEEAELRRRRHAIEEQRELATRTAHDWRSERAAAARAFAESREAVKWETEEMRREAERVRAEVELRLMEHEEELSRRAATSVWAEQDDHREWRREVALRTAEEDRREFELHCMQAEDSLAIRMRRHERRQAMLAIRSERQRMRDSIRDATRGTTTQRQQQEGLRVAFDRAVMAR